MSRASKAPPPRGRGQPPKGGPGAGPTPGVLLRLTPALLARLDAEVARLGCSRTAAVEVAVSAWLERGARAPGARLKLDDATGPAILARAIAERSTVGEVAERAMRTALNRQMAEPPRRRRKNEKAPG